MKEVTGINDSKNRMSVDQKINYMTKDEIDKSLKDVIDCEDYSVRDIKKWVAEMTETVLIWQMQISEKTPVLCWVWDVDSDGVPTRDRGAQLIGKFDSEALYPYRGVNDQGLWTYASPVLESDIYKEQAA
tara:strand:- start:66 stop:455 length:390 start_codon:yes stop_codon:yes gene_type:complete